MITDPPYNSGGRTAKERTSRTARQKYTSADAGHTLPDFTGENMDQRSYGFWLTQIMTEAHRLTRVGGTALLFTDWRQLPVTTDAIQAAALAVARRTHVAQAPGQAPEGALHPELRVHHLGIQRRDRRLPEPGLSARSLQRFAAVGEEPAAHYPEAGLGDA